MIICIFELFRDTHADIINQLLLIVTSQVVHFIITSFFIYLCCYRHLKNLHIEKAIVEFIDLATLISRSCIIINILFYDWTAIYSVHHSSHQWIVLFLS